MKRKAAVAEAEDVPGALEKLEEQQPKKFAKLKPRTKNISQHDIRTKWTRLSSRTQGSVKSIIRDAERPAISAHRDERRRVEAQEAVRSVVNM